MSSKPFFLECTLPGRAYMHSHITNKAVNLSICKSITKARIHWYPDNTGIPSLKFDGCDVEWGFSSDSQRDKEYDRIMSLVGPKVEQTYIDPGFPHASTCNLRIPATLNTEDDYCDCGVTSNG